MNHEVVEYRCFGPPGTGKTTWMATQVQNAVERHGPDAVIVSSFTRTAAAEIAGRGLPLDKSRVGTLHAHCYRALGYPSLTAKIVGQWNEDHPYLALSTGGSDVDDPTADRVSDGPGDEESEQYHRFRSMMRPRELWPESVQSFGREWEAWKAETGTLDFTDLIEVAYQDVLSAPGAPSIGFYDEVQDFVPLQLALVRKWAQAMEYIVLAGDDDQAIYGWLGASPDAFLNPPVSAERKRVLAQSYRVPAAIHRCASAWVNELSQREPKAYQPRNDQAGSPVEGEVRSFGCSWKSAESLLVDAQQYLDAGKSVMFLASCGYMLGPLLATMRREGVPFHNPYRRKRGDWNPLTPSKGISSAERLLAYLRPDVDVWGEESRQWNPEDLRRWVDVIEAKGVLKHGAKTQLDVLGTNQPLEWLAGLEPYFEDQAAFEATELHLDWFERHLKSTAASRLKFPLAVARERGGAMLRKTPQIIVGTIHSVKGGEADVVYLIPDLSRAAYGEWQGSIESHDGIIRLFYVGLTRARETVVLCAAAGHAVTGLAA